MHCTLSYLLATQKQFLSEERGNNVDWNEDIGVDT
jgi:hypothetical protein